MTDDEKIVNAFRSGMRALASGVSVIATMQEGAWFGLTATAVCSLSAAPPSLIVCVNRAAGAHNPMASSKRLTVNVLAAEQQEIAEVFSGVRGLSGSARFSVGNWRMTSTGLPILSGALASFECEVAQIAECATHSVFMCLVRAVAEERGDPLIYWQSGYVPGPAQVLADPGVRRPMPMDTRQGGASTRNVSMNLGQCG